MATQQVETLKLDGRQEKEEIIAENDSSISKRAGQDDQPHQRKFEGNQNKHPNFKIQRRMKNDGSKPKNEIPGKKTNPANTSALDAAININQEVVQPTKSGVTFVENRTILLECVDFETL